MQKIEIDLRSDARREARIRNCEGCGGEPKKVLTKILNKLETKFCAECLEVCSYKKINGEAPVINLNPKEFDFIKDQHWHGDTFLLTPKIPSDSIDLIAEDLPYGMDWQSNFRKEKHKKIANDKDMSWVPQHVNESYRILKPGRHLYVFCSEHYLDLIKTEYSKKFEFKAKLFWDKQDSSGGMGNLDSYGSELEYILFFTKGKKCRPIKGKRGNVLRYSRQRNTQHPTEKPIDMMREIIMKSSEVGEIVLDGFGGRGTTAMAAALERRHYITIEKEAEHYQTMTYNLQNVGKVDVKTMIKRSHKDIIESKNINAVQISMF